VGAGSLFKAPDNALVVIKFDPRFGFAGEFVCVVVRSKEGGNLDSNQWESGSSGSVLHLLVLIRVYCALGLQVDLSSMPCASCNSITVLPSCYPSLMTP
jgi:hypothetical protein